MIRQQVLGLAVQLRALVAGCYHQRSLVSPAGGLAQPAAATDLGLRRLIGCPWFHW